MYREREPAGQIETTRDIFYFFFQAWRGKEEEKKKGTSVHTQTFRVRCFI